MTGKIHFRARPSHQMRALRVWVHWTGCGHTDEFVQSTAVVGSVTCKSCQNSTAFKLSTTKGRSAALSQARF